jgi:hypothetical protein
MSLYSAGALGVMGLAFLAVTFGLLSGADDGMGIGA